MAEADVCCGMGGSYSVKLPEISAPMLKRKLGNLLATGAPLRQLTREPGTDGAAAFAPGR